VECNGDGDQKGKLMILDRGLGNMITDLGQVT